VTFLPLSLNVSPFQKNIWDASSSKGIAELSKLLNGIYVTKNIVANLSTKLFNGHDGTKVRTASFADASGWRNNRYWHRSIVPFGYMAIQGLEKLFTNPSNF
jgi:hypothetical protein